MAVDTRNKRASCLGLGLAALLVLPAPDAAVETGDRAHVAYCYAGIDAGSPVVVVTPSSRTLTVAAQSRVLTVPSASRTLTVPAESRVVTA